MTRKGTIVYKYTGGGLEHDGVVVELFSDGCAMVGILLIVCMGMENSLKIRKTKACSSKNCKWCR